MENTTLNFNHLQCQAHSDEKITILCLNEQCLKPLCATCICSHTEKHVRNCTKPKYKSLKDLHTEYHRKIFDEIEVLREKKTHIKELIEKSAERKKSLSQNLAEMKKSVLMVVQNTFKELQERFENDILEEQKFKRIESNEKLQQLENQISTNISELLNDAQELNSNQFLQAFDKIHKYSLNNSHHFSREMASIIEKNNNFESNINQRREYLSDISSTIRKMFTLNFKYLGHSNPLKSPVKEWSQSRLMATTNGSFLRSTSKSSKPFFRNDSMTFSVTANDSNLFRETRNSEFNQLSQFTVVEDASRKNSSRKQVRKSDTGTQKIRIMYPLGQSVKENIPRYNS